MGKLSHPEPSLLRLAARDAASEAIYVGRANTVRALLLMADAESVADLPEDRLDAFCRALAMARMPRVRLAP